MALLGTAALAMWWDVTAGMRDEFEDWHSHEHFVERLGIPGFYRASRWRSSENETGIFVMYELRDHDVLGSPAYVQRLNAPTPWSTKMMPHHHGMVRSQCRVLGSMGGAVAGHALTVRLAGSAESDTARDTDAIGRALGALVARIATGPGIAGAHLLRHDRPAIAQTTEQKIRGGDQEADWVLVTTGYDADMLTRTLEHALRDDALTAPTAGTRIDVGRYTLAHSATPGDIA